MIVSRPAQSQTIPDTPEKLDLATPSERFPAKWYPRVGDGTDVLPAPVTDHPYTAISGEVSARNGASSNSSDVGFQARDRLGRTRSEAVSGGVTVNGQDFKIKTVTVYDPVSHCNFHWMQPVADLQLPTDMRVAFVTCGPQTLRYKEMDIVQLSMESIPDGTSQSGDRTTKAEHLASLKMDGYTISRLRVTTSRPDEKDHVVNFVAETWYSPELKEVIRLGDQDGYSGLTNIKLADPDPKVFYPPDNYRIEVQAAR